VLLANSFMGGKHINAGADANSTVYINQVD